MKNPLDDLIPAKHRRRFYAIGTLALLVVGSYQAADGDWVEFSILVLTAIFGTGMAASNTHPEEE